MRTDWLANANLFSVNGAWNVRGPMSVVAICYVPYAICYMWCQCLVLCALCLLLGGWHGARALLLLCFCFWQWRWLLLRPPSRHFAGHVPKCLAGSMETWKHGDLGAWTPRNTRCRGSTTRSTIQWQRI